ncbi:tetratricopeptide repeat protein [bacterium]|nr:tetratricopeptide repeat protein [bacterium]
MTQTPAKKDLLNESEITTFTVHNSRYFLYKWNFTRGLGVWNWGAFIAGPLWFAYRKQYGWSLVLALGYLIFDFFFTTNPLYFTFSIELMLFSGLIANLVYLSAFHKARALADREKTDRFTALKKRGNVKWPAPFILLVAMLAVTLLLPSLFNIHLFDTQIRRANISSWVLSWFAPDIRSRELGLLRQDYQHIYFQGRFVPGIRLAENTVRLARMKLGQENHFTIALQSDLLEFKLKTGDHKSAFTLANNLLRLYQSQFGEDHLFVLFMMNNLVSNYIYQGRYDQARPIANNCLLILEKYPKNLKHPVILGTLALIYSNLGVINQAYCRYDQAEKFHIEALNLAVKSSKGYNMYTCFFLERMGDFYRDLLKLDQAEKFYEQAKKIAEQTLGLENPLVSSVFLKLGALKFIQKHLLQAEYLTAHAYVVNEKYFGTAHTATAASACQLGKIYFSQGKFHDADYQIKQALEITRRAIGEDNALYAGQLIKITDLYIFQNNFIAAENALAKSLEIFEKVYGKNNAMLLIPLEQLGLLYEKKQNTVLSHQIQKRINAIKDTSVWHPASRDLHRLELDDLMI